nr:PREDICTED: partitioning defective 3 homolog isoform X1 [Bemisia tabaci]
MVWKGKCEGALGLGAGGGGGPEKREASAAALAGGGGMSMSAKCGEMASKLVHIFGWRHTYQVQEAQRANHIHDVIVVGHSNDTWVGVQSLESQSDGGILDPDDRVRDVADDREQIIAKFEDADGDGAEGPEGDVHLHHGGDGASASSQGTGSPDLFHAHHPHHPHNLKTDIEVTNEQIAGGVPVSLQVRRGSEPALNLLLANSALHADAGMSNCYSAGGPHPMICDQNKRWSAAPLIIEPPTSDKVDRLSNGHGEWNRYQNSTPRPHVQQLQTHFTQCLTNNFHGNNDWDTYQPNPVQPQPQRLHTPFARDGSNRLSMQFSSDSSGFRWIDAADRVNKRGLTSSLSLPREHRRKEPLGQANSNPIVGTSFSVAEQKKEFIVLDCTSGSLGIHVVPDYDSYGGERGLLVKGIEPGGTVDLDGRLAVGDKIVEINGKQLVGQPFHIVQEIFRDSVKSPELRLRVIKNPSEGGKKQPPPPIFPTSTSSANLKNKENQGSVSNSEQMVESEETVASANSKMATVSPTKKLPNMLSLNHVQQPTVNPLMTANTRRIGRRMELELLKGPHGLGFSITTRDNPAGGNCPIYIKNILPKGAAVEDGRLRPGDRLLAVNDVELTGKSQADAVSLLRNTPPGSTVRIVVSRQDDSQRSGDLCVDRDRELISKRLSHGPVRREENEEETNVRWVEKSDRSEKTDVEKNSIKQELNRSSEYLSDSKSKSNSLDRSHSLPWKRKEILTFDIPVHDTEKAGLGVSVKGKTSANHSGKKNVSGTDLGIFIKSVLHGGAASRDGRLKTNDQLLSVNGISLLHQSNTAAMETLRTAMLHEEGPVPGAITITVARRNSSPSTSPVQHKRSDSASSHITNSSSNTETFCANRSDPENSAHTTTDNSGTSENSDNTVIFMPHKHQISPQIDAITLRNPVLDRLTGQTTHHNGLRNQSYYRATHQTTLMLSGEDDMSSPTINVPSSDIVLIEEDNPYSMPSNRIQGLENISDKPQRQRNSTSSATDITYASQLSLEEAAKGFSRDAFGRQSMSEKRHATLDAKNTDTYQRNKKLREEREKGKWNDSSGSNHRAVYRVSSAESIPRSEHNVESVPKKQLGPSLGMKKSSSLESLQTMVHGIQMAEDGEVYHRTGQGSVRVIRGRGCNESFRAAVDRSYDTPFSLPHELQMDILAEDERESHASLEFNRMKQNSGKKKAGLLKGIGSMFRFGKHRKSMDSSGPASHLGIGSREPGGALEEERENARRAAREEQIRIQEQYKRLIQKQNEQQQQAMQTSPTDKLNSSYSSSNGNNMNKMDGGMEARSRTERIQQLREQHQRRHMERQGHYPLDEREEHYDQALRQRLEQGNDYEGVINNRPGSRSGIADCRQFSHYVNYKEIQQHLNRRQQHYHSQRREPKELTHRPVSNFYEYESVQSLMNSDINSNSLPRHHMPSGSISTKNYSHSPGRQHQLYSNYYGNNQQKVPQNHMIYQRKQHGPFVTHVTIREHSPTINGPKI